MSSSGPGSPVGRRVRRLLGRSARVLDWLADPQGRVVKWLGLLVLVLGVPVGIVTLVGSGDSPRSPGSEEPSAKVDVGADIPVVEAEVGHLTPDPAALELSDRFRKGEILQLRLRADYTNVYSDMCEENLLAACDLTWAVECEDGYTPPVVLPEEGWPAGVDPYYMHCPQIWSLRTVNRTGASVAGWTYAHGIYSLEGFHVVEGVGFGQGILAVSLREIPAEVARQLVN